MTLSKRFKTLMYGDLLMLPQHYYGQAYIMSENEYGEEAIHYYTGSTEGMTQVTDKEDLAMLLDEDVLVWGSCKEDFVENTKEAFAMFFEDDGDIEYEAPTA